MSPDHSAWMAEIPDSKPTQKPQERAVGLIIMTRIKMTKDGPEELVAVLQRRGELNHETLLPESWPGACQVTAHGKLNVGEEWLNGICREAREELSASVSTVIILTKDRSFILLTEIGDTQSPKWVRTYGIFLESWFLKSVRLNASTGGLKCITREQASLIRNLRTYNKELGVLSKAEIAMFPDEIEAVKVAFEKFK